MAMIMVEGQEQYEVWHGYGSTPKIASLVDNEEGLRRKCGWLQMILAPKMRQ